jgi:dihydrodipicolinate synthase/N-acetylneuraminate lyase
MQKRDWAGVLPAITTPFNTDLSIDHGALAAHVRWLVENGCAGIVALGSLGEAQTLTPDEKVRIAATCRTSLPPGVPLIAGISALSTADGVALARRAADAGCDGLMVLPAYVYRGDWRETKAHFAAVIQATSLSCMLYNNPIAYGTDVVPEQLAELAERHDNLHAVKESSGDVRRVTALRERLGDRLALLAGMDDMILESIPMGATGWIAGLVNAFPLESVQLFELGRAGRFDEARAIYEWFLPLLRLDTVPKFVQLIKLVQAEVGRGTATVRPPRLELEGRELDAMRALIRERLANRPFVEAAAV